LEDTLKEINDLEKVVNFRRGFVIDEVLCGHTRAFVKDHEQARGNDTKA